jgi:hypothetical protein
VTIIPSVLILIPGQSVKCGHTSNQADNLCLLDSSLREREQIYLDEAKRTKKKRTNVSEKKQKITNVQEKK